MNRKAKTDTKKTYAFQVVIELDEDGKYVAWCPAFEACYTQGDTFEEAMDNIRDVIAMCLEEAKEAKEILDFRYPEVIGTRRIEVSV